MLWHANGEDQPDVRAPVGIAHLIEGGAAPAPDHAAHRGPLLSLSSWLQLAQLSLCHRCTLLRHCSAAASSIAMGVAAIAFAFTCR
jgi:hypothetical protein